MMFFAVLMVMNIFLIASFWFWFSDNNEALFLQLLDFFFFEVSCSGLLGRWWTWSFFLGSVCSVINSCFSLFLVLWLVGFSLAVIVSWLAISSSVSSSISSSIVSSVVLTIVVSFSVGFVLFRGCVFGLSWFWVDRLCWFCFLDCGRSGWGSNGWRLFFLIDYYNSDFLNNTVMNLLNDLNFFNFSFLVQDIFMDNDNFISMDFELLFLFSDCFLSIFCGKVCEWFL